MPISFDGQKHIFWQFLLWLGLHSSAGINIRDALLQNIMIMHGHLLYVLFLQPYKKKSEMRSFKSNENIHKKEDGSYNVVSANKASNHPTTKTRGKILKFCEFQIGSRFKD